jgi:uncharacterized coiled-coil protein SlyX
MSPRKPEPFPPDTTPKGARFDPKLKALAAEIQELLDRHKIGAYVALQSPNYAEYIIVFPAWGCVTKQDDRVRFYSKKADFPSPEAQKACVVATAGMIFQFEHMLTHDARQFAALARLLGEHFDINHVTQHTSPAELELEAARQRIKELEGELLSCSDDCAFMDRARERIAELEAALAEANSTLDDYSNDCVSNQKRIAELETLLARVDAYFGSCSDPVAVAVRAALKP